MRARALAGAAWLYGLIGRESPARRRLASLELLITSPYLAEPVRDQVAARFATP